MDTLEFMDAMCKHGADPLELVIVLDRCFEGYSKPDTRTLNYNNVAFLPSVAKAFSFYAKSQGVCSPKQLMDLQVEVYNPLHMRRYSPGSQQIFKDPPLFKKLPERPKFFL